ncbi:MAG: M23 family metallopeptidase [Cytophagaceae bacterium]|nr:M23 family metallopeptidase [Cytophagaceae bacterium]MDW8457448.1 M23 family metallopeptidase [Cytophagaceae bacterium]
MTTSITSKYGYRKHPITGIPQFHNGIDIAAPVGTKIYSPLNGTIKEIKYNYIGGLQLIISHSDNVETGYAHLSKVLVKIGEKVRKGDVIALTGNTGRSTGPHLHFTVKKGGVFVDPEVFFEKEIRR